MSIHKLPRRAISTERIVVGAAAAGLTTIPKDATHAAISVESATDAVFTFDGTTPTAANGHTWKATYGFVILDGQEAMLDFKHIRPAAADSAIQVTYFSN